MLLLSVATALAAVLWHMLASAVTGTKTFLATHLNVIGLSKIAASMALPVLCCAASISAGRSAHMLEYVAAAAVPTVTMGADEKELFAIACALIVALYLLHVVAFSSAASGPEQQAGKVNAVVSTVAVACVVTLIAYSRALAAGAREKTADDTLSVYLARLSHEIRTPLNNLACLVDLLKLSDLGDSRRRAWALIAGCNHDLRRIADDAYDLALLRSGKMQLVVAPTSVRDCVREVLAQFSPLAESRGNLLNVRCDDTLAVLADGQRLQQVVRAFVAAALHATSGGAVEVLVEEMPLPDQNRDQNRDQNQDQTRGQTRDPGQDRNRDRDRPARGDVALVKISVLDTGSAIPAPQLDSFFDVGQCDDGSVGVYGRGSSISMTVCKGLVECMNGRVSATSSPTVTGLVVEIPLVKTQAPPRPCPPATKPQDASPRVNILVVDDNATCALVLVALLRKLGYKRVGKVYSGADAVRRVQKDPSINVVFMDLHMPGMSGIEATRKIRAERGAKTPVVYAASAAVDEREKAACRTAMDGFLSKPLTKGALVDAMDAIVKVLQTRDSGRPRPLLSRTSTAPSFDPRPRPGSPELARELSHGWRAGAGNMSAPDVAEVFAQERSPPEVRAPEISVPEIRISAPERSLPGSCGLERSAPDVAKTPVPGRLRDTQAERGVSWKGERK